MKFKEFLLLILIVGTGIFFYHAQTGQLDIDWEFHGDVFFGYDEFTYEESREITPPFPSKLHLRNSHGEVEIQGTDTENITIDFQKIIWRRTEEQADEVNEKLQMTIDQDGTTLTVGTNRSEFGRKRFETNFKILVPEGMDIKVKNSYGLVKAAKVGNTRIDNRHGEVDASDIDGELIITNKYEDVDVNTVSSDCRVENRHADISIHDAGGKVRLGHSYGRIELGNITQDVTIEGKYSEVWGENLGGRVDIITSYKNVILLNVGPTKITNKQSRIEVDGIRESLDIFHRYGKVELSNLQGNLFIDGKNVGVYGKSVVGSSISISSSYRDVDLTGFSGKTTITLSHGDVRLDPLPLTHPIRVEGKYAKISLLWPDQEKYPFEAHAKGGDIKWNLPFELSYEQDNSTKTVKAFSWETDKPSIYFSTSYRSISVDEHPEEPEKQ
jgi:hypothetical protein